MTFATDDPAILNPITLRLPSTADFSDEEFFDFCQLNRDLRIERNAQHEVIIMTPTGSETDERNFDLIGQLWAWARQDESGVGFGSSGGFTLPNGAVRSPDAAWIRRKRWEALSPGQRQKFAPICPDFVVELRSVSDRLSTLQAKMEEYIANGASLGWLIDRPARKVYVYKPNQASVCLDHPDTLSGETVLSNFVLDLSRIW